VLDNGQYRIESLTAYKGYHSPGIISPPRCLDEKPGRDSQNDTQEGERCKGDDNDSVLLAVVPRGNVAYRRDKALEFYR
jgi:hypothetical protein